MWINGEWWVWDERKEVLRDGRGREMGVKGQRKKVLGEEAERAE